MQAWLRRSPLPLVAALYATLTLHFLLFGLQSPPPDFDVYWRTARAVLGGDVEAIYAIHGPMVFRYSPFTLAIFAPLGWFSREHAHAIWIGIQGLSMAGALFFLNKSLRAAFPHLLEQQIRITTAAVAVLIARYYTANLHTGQITPLSTLIGSLGIYLWLRGNQVLGASFLIFRSFFKILPALLLLPVLLMRGKYSMRILSQATLNALLFGSALSLIFLEPDDFWELPQDWIELVLSHHGQYKSPTHYSQSVPSVILRFLLQHGMSDQLYAPLALTFSAVLLALSLWVWRRLDLRKKQIQFGLFASASLLVRLVAPDNYPYANLPLIFPLGYIVAGAWSTGAYRGLLAWATVTQILLGRNTMSEEWFHFYRQNSLPFWSRLILFIAFLFLLERDSRQASDQLREKHFRPLGSSEPLHAHT